jgi:hypothetical protein
VVGDETLRTAETARGQRLAVGAAVRSAGDTLLAVVEIEEGSLAGLGWYPEDPPWRTVRTQMRPKRTAMYMSAPRLVLLNLRNIFTIRLQKKCVKEKRNNYY